MGIIPVRKRSVRVIPVLRWSVGVVAVRRRIMANCGRVGVCGRRPIVAIRWRVVRIGCRIAISPVISPVITSPVAHALDRGGLNVCIAYS